MRGIRARVQKCGSCSYTHELQTRDFPHDTPIPQDLRLGPESRASDPGLISQGGVQVPGPYLVGSREGVEKSPFVEAGRGGGREVSPFC